MTGRDGVELTRKSRCLIAWLLLIAGAAWQGGAAVESPSPSTDASAMLERVRALQTTDHAESLRVLAQLNAEEARLTPAERWSLRYANGWEAMYQSRYATSEALFKDVIAHSGDTLLVDRASALLMSQFGLTRRYVEAFQLANELTTRLPRIVDADVRSVVLMNLSQTSGLAGQTSISLGYAHMALEEVPRGGSACHPAAFLVEALYNGKQLKPDSPELRQAFDACPAAEQPVYYVNLQLTLADLLLHGGQPREALAIMDRIEPMLHATGYAPYRLTVQANRALALAALDQDAAAHKLALDLIAAHPEEMFGTWLKDVYQLLYRIEKKQGDAAGALGYYEKFAALDKAYLDDVNARAVAYETVQQQVLSQRLETAQLAQQNTTLRMQRALDAKKAETDRLYVLLLLAVLAFGTVAMVRLKRSQLQFKRLSRLDGLTNLLNRQHFVAEAEQALRELERQQVMGCLVFIDLDYFKRINDTYGHAAGDEVLRYAVEAGRTQLRAEDLFGRLGGEEFGILLVGCTREQGSTIADRIRGAIEVTGVDFDGVTIPVSASAGLAFTDTSGYDLQQLFRAADHALYKAKRGGRNRVFVEAVDPGLSGL